MEDMKLEEIEPSLLYKPKKKTLLREVDDCGRAASDA